MKSPLIVFSHLRWDFVYQRPQHLLSRIAHQHRVIFIEEPMYEAGTAPKFEYRNPCDNVLVLRPITDVQAGGFHDDQLKALKPLLQQLLHDEALEDYLVWFYTPMALPLLAELQPKAVIYDCMDELSAFKGAPRQMRQRESALLKTADLVLTGGPSLYQAKRETNPNVHCLPSSVDAVHYAPERITLHSEEYLAAEQLQGHLIAPRLGFFGVIDERLDIGLIAALADANPNWHIVMVGPVAKIDRNALPQHANIHWLGQQPYQRLPALVAGWDVCLLPFALNDHTRFISPTKTLEYLAAEKPVVSTPVNDVVGMYGDVVRIAKSHDAFIDACREALEETPHQRAERLMASASTVSRFSWDESARTVLSLMEEAVARGRRPMVTAEPQEIVVPATAADAPLPITPALASPDGSATAAPRAVRELIIGAGPTGLAAAYYLGRAGNTDTLLVEREDRVGGGCRSVQDQGYTWDHAGHILCSNDNEVLELYGTLLGDNLHWQNREAWVYSKNVYTRYPFQGSLYGLPADVLKECITGAIEARFGSLKANFNAVSRAPEPPPENFEEFIHRVWGKGIAKHFAVPYNEKLWTVPLAEMETSWLAGRVPLPDLEQMIEGALKPTPAPTGPNGRFGYPLRGGFQALMDGFLPHLKCETALNTRVVRVSPSNRTVLLDDGRTVQYDTLISTMPLPQLVQACGEEAPPEVQAAAKALRHVSVRCVNLGIARENITDKHWIYYPEDTVFHRIFVQGNASPHCNAPGGFALTAEITYSPSKPLPCDGQALIERVVADCRRVGLLTEEDTVAVANQVDLPCGYVVYDHARATNVQRIRDWMGQFGIVLAGRYGEWAYYNADHAFIAGRKAAEQALEAQRLLREAVGRRANGVSANEAAAEEAPKLVATGGGADEPAPLLKAAAAVRAAEIARLSRAAQTTR